MYISYDYYRIFYYVAKYRSITQAANMLLGNQPNVTRTIKLLENALGCKLFVRSNKGVVLTPEGEKLYANVEKAFAHIQNAENELMMYNQMQNGSISIGASEVALRCFLLPVLKQFRELYPDIRIKVTNHSTPQAIEALTDGLVDFAVVTTPVDVPKGAVSVMLKEVQEAAVCGEAYAHLADKTMSLSDLCGYPIVCLGSKTKTYQMYTEWFAKHSLTLTPDIEAATADQILPMVKHGLGIGFVPLEFLNSETDSLDVYKLKLNETVPLRSVCLIKSTSQPLSVAATKLEKMILEKKI